MREEGEKWDYLRALPVLVGNNRVHIEGLDVSWDYLRLKMRIRKRGKWFNLLAWDSVRATFCCQLDKGELRENCGLHNK